MNGEPYPFEAVDVTMSSWAVLERDEGVVGGRADEAYALDADLLALKVGDLITVEDGRRGSIVDYGSDETCTYDTRESDGTYVALEQLDPTDERVRQDGL